MQFVALMNAVFIIICLLNLLTQIIDFKLSVANSFRLRSLEGFNEVL